MNKELDFEQWVYYYKWISYLLRFNVKNNDFLNIFVGIKTCHLRQIFFYGRSFIYIQYVYVCIFIINLKVTFDSSFPTLIVLNVICLIMISLWLMEMYVYMNSLAHSRIASKVFREIILFLLKIFILINKLYLYECNWHLLVTLYIV